MITSHMVVFRTDAESMGLLLVLVPKLCLGTGVAKLCFVALRPRREAELPNRRSQAELGNEMLAHGGVPDLALLVGGLALSVIGVGRLVRALVRVRPPSRPRRRGALL